MRIANPKAWVDVVQAVATARFGPVMLNAMER